MKHALVFSPYFDTWGGGEVYTLSFAAALHQLGYHITLAAPSSQVLADASKYLDISLQAEVNPQAYITLTSPNHIWSKYRLTKTYDLVFFLSDGSLPFLFGHTNIVHFQVPFTSLKRTFTTSLKLATIHHIVCNSRFTSTVIDRRLRVNSTILYPPVRLINAKHQSKQNIILSVGRFTQTMHHKRQDILATAFKKLIDQGLKNWQLVIAGSTTEKGSNQLVSKLKTELKGYPVEILTDISYAQVRDLYAKSKIFWLATGYDVNQTKHPEHVEHFGIATVEAMSAGCVPVVINQGGQPEIVTDGVNGYLFNKVNELVSKTNQLIKKPQLLSQISQEAISRSHKFSSDQFSIQVKSLVS